MAPPYTADLFLAFVFSVLHWAFRPHRFLFQAIVQLGSSTLIPPHLSPPCQATGLISPSPSLPACSVMLHVQAAHPTTQHQALRPSSNAATQSHHRTEPFFTSCDINTTTMILSLYKFKMKVSKQEKRTFGLFSFYLLFSWLSICTGFDSNIFLTNLGPIKK